LIFGLEVALLLQARGKLARNVVQPYARLDEQHEQVVLSEAISAFPPFLAAIITRAERRK